LEKIIKRISIVATFITLISKKWADAARTISLESVQFPEVQDLVKQGWVINPEKSGKFTSKLAK